MGGDRVCDFLLLQDFHFGLLYWWLLILEVLLYHVRDVDLVKAALARASLALAVVKAVRGVTTKRNVVRREWHRDEESVDTPNSWILVLVY